MADGLLSRTTFERDGHDAMWTPDGTALTYTSVEEWAARADAHATRSGAGCRPADVLRAARVWRRLRSDGWVLVETVANSLGANSAATSRS